MHKRLIPVLVLLLMELTSVSAELVNISPSVTVIEEEVNGVVIERNNRKIIIYGVPHRNFPRSTACFSLIAGGT